MDDGWGMMDDRWWIIEDVDYHQSVCDGDDDDDDADDADADDVLLLEISNF